MRIRRALARRSASPWFSSRPARPTMTHQPLLVVKTTEAESTDHNDADVEFAQR